MDDIDFESILSPGLELEKQKLKDTIQPPVITYRGRLLTFDQSLSSTGWALITGDEDGAWIWKTGVLKSAHDLRGHAKTLERFSELFDEISDLLRESGNINDIVFETPPVGRAMIRPESSLLAAAAIIGNTSIPTHMVSRQKASKRWTGQANSPKKDIRNSLMSFGYTPKKWGLAWNEHISDALSLGLFYMENLNG